MNRWEDKYSPRMLAWIMCSSIFGVFILLAAILTGATALVIYGAKHL